MYIATVFIGNDYTPGEILPEDTDAELIRRLLKAGAIREAAPVPERKPKAPEAAQAAEQSEPEAEAEEEIDEDEAAPEIDIMDGIVRDEPKPAAKKSRRKGKRNESAPEKPE